jgi:peptide/nickel transport system substrate-binding protein
LLKKSKIWPDKWPTKKQWAQLPKIFSPQERRLVLGLIFVIFCSVLSLAIQSYFSHSQVVADYGGQYQEGIIGQPRYLNPILAQTNDADRALVRIIFSSLLKYDGQGNLIPDLAERYEIKEQGLVYDFFLRKNIQWHDGQTLTADDVVFTIQTIQDPEYKSPLRINWQGVEVEKIDDYTVRFKLKNTYAPFLHNLTVGILPKHLWAGISAQNFPLAEYNLKPIGSGPYKFKKFEQNHSGAIQSIELKWHKDFYLKKPFIEKLIFRFYTTEEAAIKAYNKRQVDGLSFLSVGHQSEIRYRGLNIHQISLPRYYTVFFNQTQSKALANKTVRLALAYATDKKEIIDRVLNGQGLAVNSPLLPGCLGYTNEIKIYDFALEHAKNILDAEGWQDSDGDGIREKKINEEESKLEFTLVTTEWPELIEVANLLKEQWEKIGAKINIEVVSLGAIQQDYIRPRQYQALLFGEVLGADPDPFAFWHSSQKRDPGLNLALYNNKKVDKLLEEARQTLDEQVRAEKYKEFQQLVVEDIPVIFLYSPTYLYPVNKKVKGISIERLALPSQRFCQIENWYIETKRIWK